MFGMSKTLIVVYKDEMVVNQLKKMVETHDDKEEGIIGTRDDSVNVVAWTEKVWLNNKKAGNITDKVLFLGDISGTDKLIPVLDIKFNQFGVQYGWAGNQAVLFVDSKEMHDKDIYLDFIEQLSKLSVPDMIKEPINTRYANGEQESTPNETEDDENKNSRKKINKFLGNAKNTLDKGVKALDKVRVNVASKTEDLLRDKKKVTRQQLFYGVVNLYNNDLDNFMNA
ncbi:hypothetical protein A9CBEGH2_04540 [Amedibacterium intestinale]|jgi:hypothetical protein|uniref:hypothetical protein n=1 Tax=Amedibacterium intestinale TaxID=2583452 RepID=UPI0013744FD2|nr:hypothetical protein [Amedibacterium intestinale]BBK61514.1 hypothetical protein A9CBEGH2_04540 [Amedibacterium intestinale]